MNFDLTEEQDLLQETVRQFASNVCTPSRRRAIFDGKDGHDTELWHGLLELGLGAIAVPDEFGGAGLELLDLALAAEVLGAEAVPGPFLGHSLAGLAIAYAGSDAQKKSWLPKLASGEALGTIAFAEGDGRWQPEQWSVAAGATLDGTKAHVPFGEHADLFVVGTRGGGLALVERGARGLAVEPLAGIDRTRRIAELRLANTPCDALAGGPAAAARVRDAALVLLAADAFGGAAKLVDLSVEYAKTRQQFGVTIGELPGAEAPARGHGRRGRAGARLVLVRGARVRPRARRVGAQRGAGQVAPDPGLHAGRARRGRGARRDRLHLGARRPDLLQARDVRPRVPRHARRAPRARGRARRLVRRMR